MSDSNKVWKWVMPIRAVAGVTFSEILRDKVLFNILLFGLLLLGMGILVGRLAVLNTGRVLLDLGLSAVSLSTMILALLYGATMLGREFERRTIHVALSRPISRLQFVAGKFCGLCGVLFLNWVLMALCHVLILWSGSQDDWLMWLTGTWFAALVLVLIQAWVVAALGVFFSSVSTSALSVMFVTGLILIGKNISQVRWYAARTDVVFVKWTLNFFASLVPNFEHFDLGAAVSYGLPVLPARIMGVVGYAAMLIVLAVVVAGRLVQRKES